MGQHNLLIIAGVVPVMGALCFYDWKYRRLPNVLTLGLLAASLLIRLLAGGSFALISGAAGGLIGGAFLLIPFWMKGAGGGDLKMMTAAGSIVGVAEVCTFLLLTSILGLVLGGVMAIFRRVDAGRCIHYIRCVFDWHYDRKKGREKLSSPGDEKGRIPFGIAIAAGTVLTLLLEYFMQ